MAKFRQVFGNRSDFLRLKNASCVFRARFFIVNAAPAATLPARYGMTATKKSFDNAVRRNRARRLLREWLRLSADKLDPALDYSFVLRMAILDTTREDGLKELARALRGLKCEK